MDIWIASHSCLNLNASNHATLLAALLSGANMLQSRPSLNAPQCTHNAWTSIGCTTRCMASAHAETPQIRSEVGSPQDRSTQGLPWHECWGSLCISYNQWLSWHFMACVVTTMMVVGAAATPLGIIAAEPLQPLSQTQW